MNNFYNQDLINEKLNLNYDIKRIKSNEYKIKWIFKIDGDLYTIDAGKIKKDTWDITFSFTAEGNKETVTSLTNKNIPLKVLSAVATAIKELMIEVKPDFIEMTVFGDKKSKIFFNLIKSEIKDYSVEIITKKSELMNYNVIKFKKV
jgi:hypothetical protein